LQELLREHRLEQHLGRAELARSAQSRGDRRDRDHRRTRGVAPDQLQAVEQRHHEIRDDHLRMQLEKFLTGVGGLPTGETLVACTRSCATRRVAMPRTHWAHGLRPWHRDPK
jgi:hypothetical protein